MTESHRISQLEQSVRGMKQFVGVFVGITVGCKKTVAC